MIFNHFGEVNGKKKERKEKMTGILTFRMYIIYLWKKLQTVYEGVINYLYFFFIII